MEPRIERLNRIAPRRIRVQAALWVTELHGPDRDANLEARVRTWIAADPRHAAAFELATEAWQRSGNLHRPNQAGAQRNIAEIFSKDLSDSKARVSRPRLSAAALTGMVVLCSLCIYAVYFLRNDTLVTGPAEQSTTSRCAR
jgi:ferric-dicitrate binding protein FerR (iron transport regulator)